MHISDGVDHLSLGSQSQGYMGGSYPSIQCHTIPCFFSLLTLLLTHIHLHCSALPDPDACNPLPQNNRRR